MQIVAVSHEEIAQCKQILRSLPEWFGIEQSIVDYVRDIHRMPVIGVRIIKPVQ